MRRTLLCVLCAAASVLAGCSGGSQDAGGPRKLRVAVIPKGTSHAFWKSIHAGARKAQQELGDVEITWVGPATEDDRAGQINLVDTLSTNVDAVVLAPTDREALVKPVENAMARGVPVVIIDSGLNTEKVAAYISTDNREGGRLAARHMGKLLDGKGKVIVLRYQAGSESTEQREAGFIEVIENEFPDVEILSSSEYGGPTQPTALTKAENLLTRFGKDVDGWFCPCEPITTGTVRAVETAGLGGKIKIVGFDAGADLMNAMRRGTVHGLVLQDPIQMGYLGVKTAVAKVRGESVEPRVSTGEYLVTPENMDDPRSRELHSPDLAKWLGE
jgi:ribose transport system substrate-binding protein